MRGVWSVTYDVPSESIYGDSCLVTAESPMNVLRLIARNRPTWRITGLSLSGKVELDQSEEKPCGCAGGNHCGECVG